MANVKLEYYSSEYCGPCRIQKNIIEVLNSAVPYTVPLSINTEANVITEVESIDATIGNQASDNEVANVPTIIIRDFNGKELSRITGVKPQSFIEDEINAAVAGIV